MKELFYFSFADLMARIEYHQAANSLRYATHREMTFNERFIVEQYLLADFAPKTEYYKRQPASFIYLGTDKQLTKAMDTLHLKNTSRELEEQEVNDSVSGLISRSMQNYYFEQIGDMILEARREMAAVEAGIADERRGRSRFSLENMNASCGRRKKKLAELVEAYNVYADQKIAIGEIIPSELKSYFGIPAAREYFGADHAVREGEPSEWAEERIRL
ncbi:hypothetical protein L0337_22640 [candidate division KSB1 bacterium]|nr:hypothetical protein [candidate division KSB1 bacterium]